jgi:uncharacterized protein (UPF0332 family)
VTPDDYVDKASRALTSAKLLLADGDIDGASNRAYYVMFDAAHAALLWSGAHINPAETKTHSGLIGAFGRHLVKTGRIAPDFGRSLNEVERIRRLADYTGDDISHEKATWAIQQAETFLQVMQAEFRPKKSNEPAVD